MGWGWIVVLWKGVEPASVLENARGRDKAEEVWWNEEPHGAEF